MTSDQYVRHFSVLGKLCYLYDLAAVQEPVLQQSLSAYLDQVANDDPSILSLVIALAQNSATINNAIINGPAAIQDTTKLEATRYLTNYAFTHELTTTPANTSVAAVLTALATEMGAGVDNKTLTTKSSAGLVNFFDEVAGTAGTWNTASPGDYPDATYVSATVIADP